MNVWTYNWQGSTLTIPKALGVYRVSVQAINGSIRVKGDWTLVIPGVGTYPSDFITIQENNVWNLQANITSPIGDIVIDPNGNTAAITLAYG